MKTALVRITGNPQLGDDFAISVSDRARGGRTDARLIVGQEDAQLTEGDAAKTIETLVDALVRKADRWDGFKAKKSRPNMLTLMCSDAVDNVDITGVVHIGNDLAIDVEEL